jgi:hypothetical protein
MVLLVVYQHKQFQDQISDGDELMLVLFQPGYILLVFELLVFDVLVGLQDNKSHRLDVEYHLGGVQFVEILIFQ